ncbi:MAG: hypothetical protein EOO92_27645 [Pedobacter sp.]|nr:MAG: hypothetical protein EOO92_27645 [Pedobacter sp.]
MKILNGGKVTISNSATLQIAGAITSPVGAITATTGNIELNGTGPAQSISGSWFKNNNISRMIVSNNLSVAAASADSINILTKLSFGNADADLVTNNNITSESQNFDIYINIKRKSKPQKMVLNRLSSANILRKFKMYITITGNISM